MIFLTVFAVSIDAYAAGMSLAENGRVRESVLLYIASYSFFLPFVAINMTNGAFGDAEWLNTASACIIIILGLRGMLPERKKSRRLLGEGKTATDPAGATLLGVSLSVDTSVGAAALGAYGSAIAVPLLMFCAHYILLSLGRHTAKLFGAAESAGLVTSALLVALGIYRLIG